VVGSHGLSALPAVRTIADSGVPGFAVGNWTGLFGQAGTPAAIVAKLHAEAQRVMKLP